MKNSGKVKEITNTVGDADGTEIFKYKKQHLLLYSATENESLEISRRNPCCRIYTNRDGMKMALSDRCNKSVLLEILENAKKELICEELVEHRREVLISYNSRVALEEIKREIVDLTKIRKEDKEQDILLETEIKETARKYDIELRTCYLVKETKAEKAFEIFIDYVRHSIPGLCITRQPPDGVREKYGLVKTPILWLSKTPGENNLSPTDLGMLRHTILEYIEKSGDSIVLLDGLEYLLVNNDFSILLKYLDDINEKMMMNNSSLLIPIDPRILEMRELALLERNMKIIKETEEAETQQLKLPIEILR